MATEMLPPSSDGLEQSVTETTPVGGAVTKVVTYSGPVDLLTAKRAALLAATPALNGLASTVLNHSRGRGTLTCNYERINPYLNPPSYEDAIQELRGFKLVRDIYTAEYFSSLTDDQILDVRNLYEQKTGGDPHYNKDTIYAGFVDKQKELYGHLTHGQESYIYTAYELTQSWKTTSDRRIAKSCSEANRVAKVLPKLNSTTRKMITSLKFDNGTVLSDGEWLKDPPELTYLGKGYWLVAERWVGLPKHSVIYGGTFKGA